MFQRHTARSQDDRLDLDLSALVEKGCTLRPDEFPVVGTDLAQQRNGFPFGVCKGNCRGVLDLNVEGQGQTVAHAAVLDWHLPPKPSEDQQVRGIAVAEEQSVPITGKTPEPGDLVVVGKSGPANQLNQSSAGRLLQGVPDTCRLRRVQNASRLWPRDRNRIRVRCGQANEFPVYVLAKPSRDSETTVHGNYP